MKVLFFGVMDGGEGTFIKNLINNPPANVEYYSVLSGQSRIIPEIKNYRGYEKFLNIWRIMLRGGLCIKVIKLRKKFDLIHLHGMAIKILNKKLLSPIIFSASGNMWQSFLDFYNWGKFKYYKAYYGTKILYKTLKIIDRIHNNTQISKLVTWSEFVKNTYIKYGVPEEKIEVIYPGFPRPKHIVTQKKNKINFTFIAGKNKFERKGGYLVLKAFKKLSKKYNNVNLYLIGDIPNHLLNSRIKNVKFLGYVDLKTLYSSIYPSTNVLILPTYADGFPTVCAEVQGYGIPVITTNIWSNPEIVIDGKTGFLINPGNINELISKMEELIENKELRIAMGKAAKTNFLNKFSIEVMIKKYEKLYTSLVN